jgi:peptidoglycan/LPS O-acetylase OafA/YrhL
MTLPPPGDPRRPLQLAIRSTRLLGVLFILLGLITPLPTLHSNPNVFELPWPVVASSLIQMVPGLLYLVCAVLLKRRRRSAVISALGLVAVHCVMVAGSLAAYSELLVSQTQDFGFLIGALLVMLLAMAALGQLFFHLTKSLKIVYPQPADEPPDDSVISVA